MLFLFRKFRILEILNFHPCINSNFQPDITHYYEARSYNGHIRNTNSSYGFH